MKIFVNMIFKEDKNEHQISVSSFLRSQWTKNQKLSNF